MQKRLRRSLVGGSRKKASTTPPASSFDLDAALRRLGKRKRALIFLHDNPDPDSIAAAEGLRLLFAQELGVPSTLALGGIIGRAENRALVHELKIALVPIEKLDLAKFDLVATVDTQPGSGNNSVPAALQVDVVIDHHPLRGPIERSAWVDVRSSMGASSTIVYEYLRRKAVPIDTRLATAFLYALKSETRDLGREATTAERSAYVNLVALADHAALYRITSPKLPREHFIALDRALRNAHLHDQLLAVNLGQLNYPDLVAEIADLLLPYEGVRWVLCVGYHRRAVYLSIRTDIEEARAGELIRRVVGANGAAGGHGMIAGGRLFAKVESASDLAPIYDQLVRGFCSELKMNAQKCAPLIPASDRSSR